MRKALRVVRTVAFVLAGLVALWFFGGYLGSWWWMKRADEGWAKLAEPMDRLVARYPKSANNEAAAGLDEVARGIGLRIMAGEKQGAGTPRDEEALKAVRAFVTERNRAENDALGAAPAAVRGFLAGQAPVLDAIESRILGSGPLVWAQDIDGPPDAPFPSFLAYRDLQNVLLARALEAGRERRPAQAERALEASWSLQRSMGARSELIAQLIVAAIAGMQHGVLRSLPDVSEAWVGRVADQDFKAAMLRSYQVEAYTFRRLALGTAGESATGRFLAGPYLRLMSASYSEELGKAVQELRDGDPCAVDFARKDWLDDRLPRWNVLGRIAGPSLLRAWASVTEASLDAELTRQVLEARALLPGTKHADPEGRQASTVCPSVSWIRERGADGRITVRTEGRSPAGLKSPRPFTFTLARARS